MNICGAKMVVGANIKHIPHMRDGAGKFNRTYKVAQMNNTEAGTAAKIPVGIISRLSGTW